MWLDNDCTYYIETILIQVLIHCLLILNQVEYFQLKEMDVFQYQIVTFMQVCPSLLMSSQISAKRSKSSWTNKIKQNFTLEMSDEWL
jgi:hypothetical protein